MINWKTRQIENEDITQLGLFTRLIYGDMWKRAGDETYYKWKLFSGFLPKSNARVAVIGIDIVGSQLSCHRRFRFGDRTFWSTELGDTMTHPSYRRQGMWASIARPVIADALEKGFMPITGFPNKYAYSGWINNLDMEHFFNIWRLALVLKPPPFSLMPRFSVVFRDIASSLIRSVRMALTRLVFERGGSLIVERNVKVKGWADRLWEQERLWNEAGVVKDASYLKWRFEKNPDDYTIYLASNGDGKPLGFLITKIREKDGLGTFGFIADMLVPSRKRNVLYGLLLKAEDDFRRAGVILVDAWVTSNPFYFYSLLSFGFFPVTRLPFIVPVSQARLLRSKGWGPSRRWILTMADSDNI